MKAATLYNVNEPLQIKDLQQDEPKAGEVRVKMGVAGICASDHHVMTGTAVLDMPVVLGHEGWARRHKGEAWRPLHPDLYFKLRPL